MLRCTGIGRQVESQVMSVGMERCVQIGRWAQVGSYVSRNGKLCAGRKVGKSNHVSRKDTQVGRVK